MSTKVELRHDLAKVYKYLQIKANSKGLISFTQQHMADDLGFQLLKFHRLLHQLIDEGLVKISGGGRYGKRLIIGKGIEVVFPDQSEPAPPLPPMEQLALDLMDAATNYLVKARNVQELPAKKEKDA